MITMITMYNYPHLTLQLEHIALHNKIASTKTIWSFHWTVLSGHIQSEHGNQATLPLVPTQLFCSTCWCWYCANDLLDQLGIMYRAPVLGNDESAKKKTSVSGENATHSEKGSLLATSGQCRMSSVSASSCSLTVEKFGIFVSLAT